MISVVFCTPSLNHAVSLEYLRSMLGTQQLLTAEEIPAGMIVRGGDCFVAKVRNKSVTEFLRNFPDSESLFFIDDDVGWPPEKVIEFLARPEDIVAGIYPKKSEAIDFPVELAVNPETLGLIERDGLVRANAAPTGFMRIKRRVLERLAADARMFRDLEADGTTPEFHGIFEDGIGSNGWWWGEDYTFCQKWAALAGEIWVDPSIEFSHRGHRKWVASLADHLDTFRSRAKFLAPIAPARKDDPLDLNQGGIAHE